MRAFIALAFFSYAAHAHDCDIGGVAVNPDNGATYAGKTGTLTCRDENGEVKSERAIVDGEFIGRERTRGWSGEWIERTVNANGNSDGPYRERYADGTVKREATYVDGDAVGLWKNFHPNGQLERAGYAESASGVAEASVEFGRDGKLQSFRCAAEPRLDGDRERCGFGRAKPVVTDLHRAGKLVARVGYANGQLVSEESLAPNGGIAESRALVGGREIRKSFHAGGAVASETEVADGFRVREASWYMNGRMKSEVRREAKERGARIVTKEWRDDGTLARETAAIDRTVVQATDHDAQGRVAEMRDYDADGVLARKRKFAADGSVTADERYYPDGSRRE